MGKSKMMFEDLLELGLGFVRALSPEPSDRETLIDDMDAAIGESAELRRKLRAAEVERDTLRARLDLVRGHVAAIRGAFEDLDQVLDG